MATTTRLHNSPSKMRQSESVRDFDYDIARADMMTPFSLTLAAEKAIESAKRQLDAMDERLMRARMAMSQVQRATKGERRQPMQKEHTTTGWTEPVVSQESGSPGRLQESLAREKAFEGMPESEVERKTVEMKKLRDDLRDLRSRMSQTRSVGGALNLTPPRPRRPSAAEIPDLQALGRSFEEQHFDVLAAFPRPPSSAPTRSKDPSDRLSNGNQCAGAEDSDLDAPVVVPQTDVPFSPRPYSSLSILTPLSARPYPTTQVKSFPAASVATFPKSGKRTVSSSGIPQLRHSINTPPPFADASLHRTPSPHRRSTSSGTTDYSDPDTSTGTRTPGGKSPSTPWSQSPSHIPRHRKSLLDLDKTRSSIASLPSDIEHQELLSRVEQLLARISVLDTGTEEERRRRRKLQAALAILEESEEE